MPFLIALAIVGMAVCVWYIAWKVACAHIEAVARAAGATELKVVPSIAATIEGKWHGYVTRWMYRGDRKRPGRAVLEIGAMSPGRLTIAHRGFWNTVLFGPPSVDLPEYGDYSVHSDDVGLAQRVLSDEKIQPLLANAIRDRRDRVELEEGCVRVHQVARTLSEKDRRLGEAFTLASTIVLALGLAPGE
jgi:hypothetical protein